MARRKVTCALQLENWQQADDALRQIGENRRDLAEIENMMNERIANAKADAEAKGRPIKDHIAMLEQALREFAMLHRADLGKAKSRTLTFGKVGFRQSTRLTLPRGVEKGQDHHRRTAAARDDGVRCLSGAEDRQGCAEKIQRGRNR